MSKWTVCKTTVGKELHNAILSGNKNGPLKITRIVAGRGEALTTQQLLDLSSASDIVTTATSGKILYAQDMTLSDATQSTTNEKAYTDDRALIVSQLTNDVNNSSKLPIYADGKISWNLRHIAIFAKTSDVDECLFLVAQDSEPDKIPIYEDNVIYSTYTFNLLMKDALEEYQEDLVVDISGFVPFRSFDALKARVLAVENDFLSKSLGGTVNGAVTFNNTTKFKNAIELNYTTSTSKYASITNKLKFNEAGFDYSLNSIGNGNSDTITHRIKTSNTTLSVQPNDYEVKTNKNVKFLTQSYTDTSYYSGAFKVYGFRDILLGGDKDGCAEKDKNKYGVKIGGYEGGNDIAIHTITLDQYVVGTSSLVALDSGRQLSGNYKHYINRGSFDVYAYPDFAGNENEIRFMTVAEDVYTDKTKSDVYSKIRPDELYWGNCRTDAYIKPYFSAFAQKIKSNYAVLGYYKNIGYDFMNSEYPDVGIKVNKSDVEIYGDLKFHDSGYGVAKSSFIEDGDFNKVIAPGIYTMLRCTNSPDDTSYWGLVVLNSDIEGAYIEQIAFKESSYTIYIRFCNEDYGWQPWEELNSKYAQKLRIFDVDGKTLKSTDGTNDLVSAKAVKITENEARLTGFSTNKYWYNLGIPNQTLKVPYSDLAIRALSFGSQGLPADKGIVRNVEGISEAVMNDPAFPTGYITRTNISPYTPKENEEFHIIYLPSTNSSLNDTASNAYGTQIAISRKAFDSTPFGSSTESNRTTSQGSGLSIYVRNGHQRVAITSSATESYQSQGYTVTDNANINDDLKIYPKLAAIWSEWHQVNKLDQIYYVDKIQSWIGSSTGQLSVNNTSGSTTNYSYSVSGFSTKNENSLALIKRIVTYLSNVASNASYAKVKSDGINSQLGTHFNTESTGVHKASQISTNTEYEEGTYSIDYTLNGTRYSEDYATPNVKAFLQSLAQNILELRAAITEHYNKNYGNLKHIPSNGAWNNILKYNSSGTAEWTPYPYTYRKIENIPFTAGKMYKVAYCNFIGTNNAYDIYGGGSALITIRAYNALMEQTIVMRANYIGGGNEAELQDETKVFLDIISSTFRGTKIFNGVRQASFNTGYVALLSAVTASDITLNITVDSSISEERVDIKANDRAWNASNNDWLVPEGGGNNHYRDYTI